MPYRCTFGSTHFPVVQQELASKANSANAPMGIIVFLFIVMFSLF